MKTFLVYGTCEGIEDSVLDFVCESESEAISMAKDWAMGSYGEYYKDYEILGVSER